jgi:pentatricopeptide repeat protein
MNCLPTAPEAYTFYLLLLDVGMPPETSQFNILMRDMVQLGELASAQNVFDEMRRRGVQPTVVSYNTLILGACKVGDLDGVNALRGWKDTRRNGDVYTFGARMCTLSAL